MSRVARWIFCLMPVGMLPSCGAVVPVQVRIDEFTVDIDIDDVANTAFSELAAQGFFPAETRALPLTWPAELPDLNYTTVFRAPAVPVDLTPEEGSAGASKYADINKAGDAITRIEINRIVLRLEKNDLTIELPELSLQVADDPHADAEDRLAWRTIGTVPATTAGFVGDNDFEFVPGGESFLNAQLSDDAKEFALRVRGRVRLTTGAGDPLPRGKATARMIVVATFFVLPEKAL